MLEMKYSFLAGKKAIPKNSGKTVYFTRYTPFAISTSALTEGANPTGVNSTASTVSASVAEYGQFERVSTLFELTSIDAGLKEIIEVHGQNAGETLDTILGVAMCAGGTLQCAGLVQLTAMASSNTMSVAELRYAVKTLKANKAPKFENGNYRGVISSQGIYELQGDTAAGNWINIGLYNSKENADMLRKGVIGSLYGVDIVEANNQVTAGIGASSASTGYVSFVAGKGAVAEIDVAGSGNFRTIIKRPGGNDTSNPLDMYSTVGWKVDGYAAKVLNADWLIRIVHY